MAGWPPNLNRWHAVVTYRGDAGPVEVPHDFEELRQLHDLVERGRDWQTIEQIVITYARGAGPITIGTC